MDDDDGTLIGHAMKKSWDDYDDGDAVSRAEHLAWCKARALEYVDRDDLASAVASMVSDLGKHSKTRAIAMPVMALGFVAVTSGDKADVRRWIEGFN